MQEAKKVEELQELLESEHFQELLQLLLLRKQQQKARKVGLTGAGGAALLGMDLGVFAVDHALRFCLCDHALLWPTSRHTHYEQCQGFV